LQTGAKFRLEADLNALRQENIMLREDNHTNARNSAEKNAEKIASVDQDAEKMLAQLKSRYKHKKFLAKA
jgi:hypothetical protein